MDRRVGNPSLDRHFIQPIGDTPLGGHLQIRIDSEDLVKLKNLPNWREILRHKIHEMVIEKMERD